MKKQPLCCGKWRYSYEDAVIAKDRAFRQYGSELRIYDCPLCQTWHLTSVYHYSTETGASIRSRKKGKRS